MIWEKATHLLPDAGTDGGFIPDDPVIVFGRAAILLAITPWYSILKKLHFNTLMNKIIH